MVGYNKHVLETCSQADVKKGCLLHPFLVYNSKQKRRMSKINKIEGFFPSYVNEWANQYYC